MNPESEVAYDLVERLQLEIMELKNETANVRTMLATINATLMLVGLGLLAGDNDEIRGDCLALLGRAVREDLGGE